MSGLTPDQVQKIHKLLHDKKLIQAIQVYRQATGVGLAEAKEAVEEMARNEFTKPPAGVRNYDDPVLESKIRSLLSKRKKVEAIKIYREEYGIELKEAKDAVDRIEASMMRAGSSSSTPINVPYESAIGADPFAEDASAGRRWVMLLAVVTAVGICGLAVFLFMLNP